MLKQGNRYAAEFRRQMVELVRAGRGSEELARERGHFTFAVARFCVPLSFAEPSLCCNVAIALWAARRPRCEQGALARRYQHPRRAMSAVILDCLIDAAGVVCGVSSGR